MGAFEFTDETVAHIAEKFNIDRQTIKTLYDKYADIHKRMKSQYLAHVMRSLEDYVRETCDAPFFCITCTPSSNNPAIKGTGCASYKKNQCFNILFDSMLDAREARVVIAHELGHLFSIITFGMEYKDKHEPLSSVFGIFTIIDKNNFYANETRPLLHHSCNDIVDDFALLKNRADERYNIS